MPESFDSSKARDDRIAARANDAAARRKRRQDEQERRRAERATPRTPQERKEDREARAKAREAEKNAPVTRADLVSGVAGVLASSASRYLTRGEFEARMSAMLSGLVANLLGSNTDGHDGNLVVRGGSIDVDEFENTRSGGSSLNLPFMVTVEYDSVSGKSYIAVTAGRRCAYGSTDQYGHYDNSKWEDVDAITKSDNIQYISGFTVYMRWINSNKDTPGRWDGTIQYAAEPQQSAADQIIPIATVTDGVGVVYSNVGYVKVYDILSECP